MPQITECYEQTIVKFTNNATVPNNSGVTNNVANNGSSSNNSLINNAVLMNDPVILNNINTSLPLVENGSDYNSTTPELLNEPVLLNNLVPNNNTSNNTPIVVEEPVDPSNIPNELEPLPEPFMNIEPFDNMGSAFLRF